MTKPINDWEDIVTAASVAADLDRLLPLLRDLLDQHKPAPWTGWCIACTDGSPCAVTWPCSIVATIHDHLVAPTEATTMSTSP